MPKFLITKCLTWDELSPEQRAKIIDRDRDILLDFITSEDLIWDLTDAGKVIADAGFLNPEIEFSYSCSQGDGASFCCEIFNWELLLEDLDIPHKSFFIKYLEEGTNISYGIARYSHLARYSHEKCRRFYIEAQYGWPSRVCEIYAKIEEHIEKKRLDLSREAFSMLVKEIDWLRSDECLAEHISSYDWYFKEDDLKVADETKLVTFGSYPVKEEHNA